MVIKYWDFNIPFMDNAINVVLSESFAYGKLIRDFDSAFTEEADLNGVTVLGQKDFAPYIKAEYNNDSPECLLG